MMNTFQLLYPNGGKRVRELNGATITDELLSLGRNGWATTTGIQVTAYKGRVLNMVEVTPITSKGNPQRCAIQIPNDPEVLRNISRALQSFADTLELNEEV